MQHLDEGVIHAWLDGQLPRDEAAAAEAHVAECRQCADAVAEARGLIAASSRILMSLDNVPRGVVPKASTAGDDAVPPATVAATPVTSGESDQVIDLRSRVATDARPAIQPSTRRPRRWLNTPALAAAAMIVVAVGTFAVSRVSNRDEMSASVSGKYEAALAADSAVVATPTPARDAAIPPPQAAPSPAALGAVARSNEEQQKAFASGRVVAPGARTESADQAGARAPQPTVERFATRKLSTTVATDSAAAQASEAKRKQAVAEPPVLADEASRLAKERALPLDTTARRREAGNVVAAMSPAVQVRVDSLARQSRADAEKPAADRRDVAAGAQAQASATTGSVRGRVTDGNNTAIATAQVTIAGTSIGVTTSASGEFTLGGVPSGARSLLVRRIGYEPVTRELTVVGNQTTTVDVTLKPSLLTLDQVVVTSSNSVTVMRGRATARPAAPAPAEAAPGAAVTAGQSNAVGCYEMSITPNTQQGRANFRQTPRRAALDAEIVPSNADGIWYRARDLARTGAVPDGLWRPVGTDGLELEWTYGTRLARIRLTGPASQMMRGTAEEIDRSNGTGEAGSVVAMRASCTS